MTKPSALRVQAICAWFLLSLVMVLFAAGPSLAEVKPESLPALTGRVVDGANVLKPQEREAIRVKLKNLEDQSGIQMAVATVSTLQGKEIEPYANALFRKWQLGQKDKNNGLLFLIAPRSMNPLRGRLRSRRHADRCLDQADPAQCRFAKIKGRRFRWRHYSRRRRGHRGPDHGQILVAKAPGAPAGRRSAGEPSRRRLLLHRHSWSFPLSFGATGIRSTGPRPPRVTSSARPLGIEAAAAQADSGDSFSGGGGDSGGGGSSDSY